MVIQCCTMPFFYDKDPNKISLNSSDIKKKFTKIHTQKYVAYFIRVNYNNFIVMIFIINAIIIGHSSVVQIEYNFGPA